MFENGMSRRGVLRTFAGAAMACAVGERGAAAAPGFSFRYALASSLYGVMPLEEILPEVAKTGAEHLDIWPKVHGNQREQVEEMGHEKFAALLEKHKLKVGIVTRYDLGPVKCVQDLPFVKKFGIKTIVTGSGGPAGLAGEDLKKAMAAFVEKMKAHAAAAAEAGAVIAIENHARALLESPDSIRWLAEMATMDGIGIAYAPYHLPQDPQLLAKLIEEMGPKLNVFYAWQHGKGSGGKMTKEEEMLQMPGRGPLDFGPMVKALRKIGFAGWTSIFMHPFPRGISILPTAAESTAAVNAGRKYLEDLVKG